MKVRFPNESYYIDVPNFKWSDFKVSKIFEDSVFGWFGDIYVNIKRDDYNNSLEK
jgi:hypothetical protein|tara:strand:- start:21 stop:185 length:165 start_codon:yes stop_codon:yes gene_type:complete